MKVITTSWDDGHPFDFRIAELLDKYSLKGTFYIPKYNKEHKVMSERNIIDLSKNFEIGGHTLNHKRLNESIAKMYPEIKGSFDWLQDLLGIEPVSFCLPGGKYNSGAISCIKKTGYKVIRTTMLLATTTKLNGLMPTTIQLYPHSSFIYLRHLLKHLRLKSLATWSKGHSKASLSKLVDYYIEYILQNNGCFHLWGHSWEIDEYNLWEELETILKQISGIAEFHYIENKDSLGALN